MKNGRKLTVFFLYHQFQNHGNYTGYNDMAIILSITGLYLDRCDGSILIESTIRIKCDESGERHECKLAVDTVV